MMNFVKTVFPFLIIPVLWICITACENDIAVVNSITSATEKQLPVESGKNVQIMYSDSARVRAKLTAVELNRYVGKKPYTELPKGMEVIFYNEKRAVQTRLTADYGISFDDANGTNLMEAKRNVVVINEKGDKLNTEHLTWNAVTKKIYTDEFVKITTKDEVIWGDGLIANQDFSEYEIKHPKGEVYRKDSEK